jgi:fido (protein-threonine AMPylation protein)
MKKDLDFDEYKTMAEPEKQEKARNWGIAIGLQMVDGLRPSKYLYEVARDNIEGKITQRQVYERLESHYKTPEGQATSADEKEADAVSSKITELLNDKSFIFAPTTLCAIHEFLFKNVYPEIAGKVRKLNITKDEQVLLGGTVRYGTAGMIMNALKYDFDNEKHFDYSHLGLRQTSEHIAKFISGIWQIHPFMAGNTRTIAVFAIKYMRTMGFDDVGNEFFEKHSKYFRNALVRANYQNLANSVYFSPEYLNRFFGNVLLGENNKLDNTDLVIVPGAVTDNKTTRKILDAIKANPTISRKELADIVGISPDGVKWNLDKLKKRRQNPACRPR